MSVTLVTSLSRYLAHLKRVLQVFADWSIPMLPAADTAACSPVVWGLTWVRHLSVLRLDIADRAVIRVAGETQILELCVFCQTKLFYDDNLIK